MDILTKANCLFAIFALLMLPNGSNGECSNNYQVLHPKYFNLKNDSFSHEKAYQGVLYEHYVWSHPDPNDADAWTDYFQYFKKGDDPNYPFMYFTAGGRPSEKCIDYTGIEIYHLDNPNNPSNLQQMRLSKKNNKFFRKLKILKV